MGGDSISVDPALDVGSSNGSPFYILDGNDFGPARESVDDREEVLKTIGFRERTEDVDMDVIETAFGWGKSLDGSLDVPLDFGSLAIQSMGRGVPVEVSHSTMQFPSTMGTSSILRLVIAVL